jgi:hypothetical protein
MEISNLFYTASMIMIILKSKKQKTKPYASLSYEYGRMKILTHTSPTLDKISF